MNITIIGAGAYALSLALRFNKNKNKIIICSFVKEEIDVLNKTKMNEKALKNVKMPSNFIYTCDIKKALEGEKNENRNWNFSIHRKRFYGLQTNARRRI